MFVVEVGAALTTYTAITKPSIFNAAIVVWLWLTVVFANLAEAVAEGRGKAQAETLRRTKRETVARRLIGWSPGQAQIPAEDIPGTQLTLGDHVVVEAGEIIPGDGDVVEGVASVDESAITGSLVSYHGRVVGSSLLCQEFVNSKGNPLPQYFQLRPSAAVNAEVKTDYGCDPGFARRVEPGPEQPGPGLRYQGTAGADRQIRSRQRVPDSAGRGHRVGFRPGPYISPQNAAIQVDRVAAARHVSPAAIMALVKQYTKGRTLGFLGEPRVTVLTLNIALDERYPASR